MATAYISRTFGTPTDEDKWTLSFWYKKVSPTAGVRVLDADGGGNEGNISFDATTGKLNFYQYQSSLDTQLITSNYYRDVGAFYHVVVIFDAANGTPSDRAQIWVNGARVTTLGTATYPTTLYSQINKSGVVHYIGAKGSAADKYCDGVFSHMNFVDGSALEPSYFGETDATSGIWKIKTSPSVTYGNNGFFLKFEDRTNLDLDSSPNAHTFTTTGTITPTYDNPSNNFATLNLLDGNIINSGGLLNGGTTYNKSTTGAGYNTTCLSTLAVSSGKWYWESKMADASAIVSGFMNTDHGAYNGNWNLFNVNANDGWGWYGTNGTRYVGTTATTSYFNTFTTNDIISFALDLDNGKCYAAKNGVWENSGDPTSGATGTGSFADITTASTFFLTPALTNNNYAVASKVYYNFGNGYFGDTAVSSAEADDAGIGAMEYDVPAGYYCLCTKNIKAYGG